MILQQLDPNSHPKQHKQNKITQHRQTFEKYKQLILSSNADTINSKITFEEINQEKENIIEMLDHIDGNNDQQFQEFEELAYYQERYLELANYIKKNSVDIQQYRLLQRNLTKDYRMSSGVYNLDDPFVKAKKINNFGEIPEQGSGFSSSMSSNALGAFKNTYGLLKTQPPKQTFQSIRQTGVTKPIFEFFDRKAQQSSKIGFKSLINKNQQRSKSPISNSHMRKTKHKPLIATNTIQIQKLLQQNKRLHQKLQKKTKQQNQLNQFEKNVLRQQRLKCQNKIQELEAEIEELQRNNYRLKQIEKQKSRSQNNFMPQQYSMGERTLDGKNYVPYTLPTRHNDLERISKKNHVQGQSNKQQQFFDMISKIPAIEKKEQFIVGEQLKVRSGGFKKYNDNMHNQSDNYILQSLLEPTIKDHRTPAVSSRNNSNININKNMNSLDNGNNFDSFSIANTAYNNSSLFLNASKNLVAIDTVTATRNKVAFFKKSLVIVKDQQFQIAFKKSDMDAFMSKIRLIFYINNKKNISQRVNIEYDYEDTHYIVNVTENVREIGPHGQAREVLEISLNPTANDLNSVIDAHFTIGDKNYDLWVPACFIEFHDLKEPLFEKKDDRANMIVQPDRQFRSYELVTKILPLSRLIIPTVDQCQAYILGKSKFGQSQIDLNWWNKELTIQSSSKILDFLGFIMHHFK